MSGYSPYYGGGWQSGESGGTPITPAALNNMENGISAALTSADVVNNLTSTTTDKPLSANMGRLLSNIGNIVYGTVTGSVSVPSATIVEVGSITVPKGTWIIFGYCDWASNENGYRQISFTNGINPGRNVTSTTNGIESKEVYQQVISIFSADTENTYTLYALQNSGSALNAYPFLIAVRIAN